MAPRRNVGETSARGASSIPPRKFMYKAERKMGYKKYLTSIREWLTEPSRVKFGLPVLSYESPKPKYPDDFFEIGLTSKNVYGVDLIIRKDNLFVVGFKPLNSGGCFEFYPEPSTPNLIPKSTILSFSGSYVDLKLKNPGLLNFNDNTLKNAIERVAHFDIKSYDDEIRKCIATLVITFCEGLRFENVADFIFRQMRSPQNKNLDSENLNYYIHNWSQFSRQL